MAVRVFNVALPASGAVVTLEAEATEGEQSFAEQFSSYGGTVFLRNSSATVNALWGGNDQNCNMPLNTGDPMTPPIPLGPGDTLTGKIATGAAAGQITVVQITH